jgi:hypothetical protein
VSGADFQPAEQTALFQSSSGILRKAGILARVATIETLQKGARIGPGALSD